jgi:phage shock protein C
MVSFAKRRLTCSGKALEQNRFPIWHGSCSVIGNSFCQRSEVMEAQQNQVALPMRPHTILGVCEAIGEDFGFSPVLLRVPFAASVLWSPTITLATYFALGAVVLASRLLFPKAKQAVAVEDKGEFSPANEQRELANAA